VLVSVSHLYSIAHPCSVSMSSKKRMEGLRWEGKVLVGLGHGTRSAVSPCRPCSIPEIDPHMLPLPALLYLGYGGAGGPRRERSARSGPFPAQSADERRRHRIGAGVVLPSSPSSNVTRLQPFQMASGLTGSTYITSPSLRTPTSTL